jgi:hypothetical protein
MRAGGLGWALAAIFGLACAGCTSPSGKTSSAAVSVSAVNYSALTDAEVFNAVHGQANPSPEAPVAAKKDKPAYYLMLPGEVYPSDVPVDSLYHQLGVSLERMGYYNTLLQVRAGRPLQIDYLFRVHYGIRTWASPVVRPDRVTWGNDGLLAKRYKTLLRNNSEFDPREGLSAAEVEAMATLSLQVMSNSKPTGSMDGANEIEARTFSEDQRRGASDLDMTPAATDFCFVVLEAFRFADVKALNTKAPCAWMIFIAVPNDDGRKFSSLLPSMLKTAEPYYGTTTNGLQVHEIPMGTVQVGRPVEVTPASPEHNPSLNIRQ